MWSELTSGVVVAFEYIVVVVIVDTLLVSVFSGASVAVGIVDSERSGCESYVEPIFTTHVSILTHREESMPLMGLNGTPSPKIHLNLP